LPCSVGTIEWSSLIALIPNLSLDPRSSFESPSRYPAMIAVRGRSIDLLRLGLRRPQQLDQHIAKLRMPERPCIHIESGLVATIQDMSSHSKSTSNSSTLLEPSMGGYARESYGQQMQNLTEVEVEAVLRRSTSD
jgi:hypothetical protein